MSSSSSLEKEIDEYQDDFFGSEGSDESSEGSTACSDSSDEHYSSGVPGIPLEEFQELQCRWLLDLGLACPDSHLTLLKIRKRMRKTSFIVMPQR